MRTSNWCHDGLQCDFNDAHDRPVMEYLMNKFLFYLFTVYYCLTACLYAKCWNLIGWIMEHGPSVHLRSGPFIRISIKDKVKDFWEDGRKPIEV